MTIEERKKELTIDPKETNGNEEMCLNSCQNYTNVMERNSKMQNQSYIV